MINNIPIIEAIEAHISNQGGKFSDWYVGITDDKERRLHQEHNVPKTDAWWITRPAANKTAAEMIEKYFLDRGCQGDTGGGNENSTLVYAYLITSTTKQ